MTAPAFKKSNKFAKKSLEKDSQANGTRLSGIRTADVVVHVVVVNRPANCTEGIAQGSLLVAVLEAPHLVVTPPVVINDNRPNDIAAGVAEVGLASLVGKNVL
jgi:hypothetical protein